MWSKPLASLRNIIPTLSLFQVSGPFLRVAQAANARYPCNPVAIAQIRLGDDAYSTQCSLESLPQSFSLLTSTFPHFPRLT